MISTFNCAPETRSKHAHPVCFFHDMLWFRVFSSGLLALEEVVSVPDICNVPPTLFFKYRKNKLKEKTYPFGDFRGRPHWTDLNLNYDFFQVLPKSDFLFVPYFLTLWISVPFFFPVQYLFSKVWVSVYSQNLWPTFPSVILERYYASLLYSGKVGLGIAGLEPATIRLKAQCSTNWAIHPNKDVVVN